MVLIMVHMIHNGKRLMIRLFRKSLHNRTLRSWVECVHHVSCMIFPWTCSTLPNPVGISMSYQHDVDIIIIYVTYPYIAQLFDICTDY